MTAERTLRRRFLLLLAVRWFQSGLQVPVLVLLLQERGLDLAAVGVITAIYGLTTVVFELPTDGLADVIGRRPALIASATLFAVESLALEFGQVFAVLAVGAALGASVGRSTPARWRRGTSTGHAPSHPPATCRPDVEGQGHRGGRARIRRPRR